MLPGGDEECDDGNTLDGDGCSSDCRLEPGYECTHAAIAPDPLVLPFVFRDFRAHGESGGHPDFEHYQWVAGGQPGIVQAVLGLTNGGKPIHALAAKSTTTNTATYTTDGSVDYFAMWYRDTEYSKTILEALQFQKNGGSYEYVSSSFFPIDGLGWGNYAETGKNYHFTSEVRYWFQYRGGEKLEFAGDDDVWVFINKKLAVDIGGVHGELPGSVTLHASAGTGHTCDTVALCNKKTNGRTVSLDLVLGQVYEIVVFQAERQTTGSNYKLTLSDFGGVRTSCRSVCGDGVVTTDEACDRGAELNLGGYNGCNPDCTLSAFCGDGIVQPGERCDDGRNDGSYGTCKPGCTLADHCGDGVMNGPEQCDFGAGNEEQPYGQGKCTTACTVAPYCGDGVVQAAFGEECDSVGGCDTQCRWKVY
jgi:fibro-slime domain-containing protein